MAPFSLQLSIHFKPAACIGAITERCRRRQAGVRWSKEENMFSAKLGIYALKQCRQHCHIAL